MDKLACGQCTKDALGKVEEETMDQFKKSVEEYGKYKRTQHLSTNCLIVEFRKSRTINKAMRIHQQRINQRYA